MDIASLNADYYTNQASQAKNKQLSNSIKDKDLSGATDEELMKVCKQFESYFVEQVLKQAMETFAKETVESESGAMSTLKSYYKDSLVTEYASKMTDKSDFGLAKTLYEQMKRNYGGVNIKDVADAQTGTEKTEVTEEAKETKEI